ncbi:hypothetical protein K491DRAFT_709242 [Lophiostoma macrostomum CBS 122681]|uniref:Fungal STAND N-terminal Goodbye domain-containing protein n=1 Tax=Lophiostoma macrostomum CBS 122681 TaxID=1314788 RepID=A0A6A6SHR9_9PLEO|nr:hypothetical protein K491DRAFT_709242 [Lophiostoma macrostomum CBS 122681]
MATSSRRLGGLVDTYLRKRLRHDIHPALTAVRDQSDATDVEAQRSIPEAVIWRPQTDDIPAPVALNDEKDVEISLWTHLTSCSEEVYRDAKREMESLEEAMKAFEETTTESRFRTEVMNERFHTRGDVLSDGLRSFGRNNKVFETWASLLPSDSEYVSVLCGGLKLIIRAAARLHDLRSEICDALAEISVLLKCTHIVVSIFERSKDLVQASSALYSAIIVAIHHIVACDLEDLLKSVRRQADRFEQTVRLHSYERIVITSQMVQNQGIYQEENHKVLVRSLDESGSDIRNFRSDSHDATGILQSKLTRMEAQVSDMTQVLVRFLSSNSRLDVRAQDLRGPNLPIRKARSEAKLICEVPGMQKALISAFDYDSSVNESDIIAGLRGVWLIPRPEQDRLVAAMQSPKLQAWITNTKSSALFLNFNASRNRQSTSFIAAKLADSVPPSPMEDKHKTNSVLALSFFCGSHAHPNDIDFGAGGMMRSLISQLLLAYPGFGLHVVRQIQKADLDYIEDLCRIFYSLMVQLPQHKVMFCLLDGVTLLEDHKSLREDSEAAIKNMMEVVSWTAEYGCCFKLLLTSPGTSRILHRHLLQPEKDCVWLPARVPSQGGFTNGKWEVVIGRGMGRLQVYER